MGDRARQSSCIAVSASRIIHSPGSIGVRAFNRTDVVNHSAPSRHAGVIRIVTVASPSVEALEQNQVLDQLHWKSSISIVSASDAESTRSCVNVTVGHAAHSRPAATAT